MLGAQLQPAQHAANDQLELAVVDAVEEDHTGMWTLCGSPLAQDRGEVADVTGRSHLRQTAPPSLQWVGVGRLKSLLRRLLSQTGRMGLFSLPRTMTGLW